MAGVKVNEGAGPEIDTQLVSVDAESRHRQRVALGPAGETRFDYDTRTDGNPVYIGTAGIDGLATTDAGWLVQRFTYNAAGLVTRIQTLSGAWDSRATLGWSGDAVALTVSPGLLASAEAVHAPTVDVAAASAWTRTETNDAAVTKVGTWTSANVSGHSGGHSFYAKTTGNRIEFTFTGIGIRFGSATYDSGGMVNVSVDGGAATTVDLYTSTVNFQQIVFELTGLTNASHTIVIEPTGTKNASSKDTLVHADFFEVGT